LPVLDGTSINECLHGLNENAQVNRLSVNWDDLRIVLAVSRAGSFQGAARLLRVTHTTIGRRIGALETRMNQRLFLREEKVCVPTPVGARLIAAAARIEVEVHATRAETSVPTHPAGLVRVISVNWVVNEILLPAVPGLRADYPDIRLALHGSLDDKDDQHGSPIVSLRFELQPARGEQVVPIARIGYAVYAPAGSTNPEDLPWVTFGGSAPMEWLEAQGVKREDIVLSVNDAAAVRTAVLSGIGRGLMPECLGQGTPGLQRCSGPAPELVRTLRAVGRKSHLFDDPGSTTIRWIAKRFADLGCGMD
jgi:DNA-binding transcriptional LysR family regulator